MPSLSFRWIIASLSILSVGSALCSLEHPKSKSLASFRSSHAVVSEWLTVPDRSSLLSLQPVQKRFEKGSSKKPFIDVDDSKTFQNIDGFGFALTGGSAQLMMKMDAQARSKLIHELFASGDGTIGVSYLRITIGSSDMNDHVFTYDDMPKGQTDPDLKHFDIAPDLADMIPVLKEILTVNPKVFILASPWSAPSWMKTNEDPKGGSLKPEYYDAYAQYLKRYVEAMNAEGIRIDALTIQNEPMNPKNTPSMVMSAEEQEHFISQTLGPLFRKADVKTKIIIYDHNCDHPDYPLTVLKDPDALQYVDGSGFHLYGGTIDAMTTVHNQFPQKNLYFTEQMVIDKKSDPQLEIATPVSRVIIGATRNWSRNVLLWNLAADPHFGPHTGNGGCPICEGAITLDGDTVTRNLAFYAVAHASKFVSPGSVRIGSEFSGEETLPNVAFRTQDNKHILIVANTSALDRIFEIRFQNKFVNTKLRAGAVATYIW
jgi:glucosylceramidase